MGSGTHCSEIDGFPRNSWNPCQQSYCNRFVMKGPVFKRNFLYEETLFVHCINLKVQRKSFDTCNPLWAVNLSSHTKKRSFLFRIFLKEFINELNLTFCIGNFEITGPLQGQRHVLESTVASRPRDGLDTQQGLRWHGFEGFGRTHQYLEKGSRTRQFLGNTQ